MVLATNFGHNAVSEGKLFINFHEFFNQIGFYMLTNTAQSGVREARKKILLTRNVDKGQSGR